MILATHGIVGSQIVQAFDLDYQAVLDYATTLGYALPIASQRIKQNKLIVDLKNANLWNKLDTFGVFQVQTTDGSVDFALLDWKRSNLGLLNVKYSQVNAPTFTSNVGFLGGTALEAKHIDLNFDLLLSKVNMSQDSATYGVFLNTTGNNFALGTSLSYTRISGSSQTGVKINSTANFTPGSNPAVGYNCYIRNGANSAVMGRSNGTFGNVVTTASTVILTQSTYLLRAQTSYSTASVGSCFIANEFNVTEWSNFVTIYNNYKNSL